MGCGSSTSTSPPPREASLPSPEDNHDDRSRIRSRENTRGSDEKRHEEEAERRLQELQDERKEQDQERRENDQKVQQRVEEERKEREEERKLNQKNTEQNQEKIDNNIQNIDQNHKQDEAEQRRREEDDKRKEEEKKSREEEERRKNEEEEKLRQDEQRREEEEQSQDQTDGGLKYTSEPLGLKVHGRDFRDDGKPGQSMARPEVRDGLYTDDEFTLNDALGKEGAGLDWKRPQEFTDSPVLFSEGTTRFDIGQGSAGTCWFLSLVASISERKDIMNQIFSMSSYPAPGTEDYCGVFHCRFWRFGVWEDIYMDDKLPVIYDTQLWGAKSATDKNEMWVALLEKAFAKFHGSYMDVYGGQTVDAFLTLTGGVGERVTLEGADKQKLFQRMTNAIESRAMVTCTVPADKGGVNGLVGAHAYSLTGTATVSCKGKQVALVRIRNPWGKVEWKGPWSDGSDEWKTVAKGSLSVEDKNDGEFWMSLDDFFVYFSQASICAVTPDYDMQKRKDCLEYITELKGEWKGQTAAGFSNLMSNPRFLLSVPKSGAQSNGLVPLVVQLVQYMEHRKDDKLAIRCDLFQVLGSCNNKGRMSYIYEKVGDGDNTYFTDRQHSFRFSVPPGEYMVVPSAYREGQENDFMVRVFSPCPLSGCGKVEDNALSMSCDIEDSLSDYKLKNCQCFFSKWCGENAGGQISHETHHKNPQLVFTVNKDEEAIVINAMQENTLPKLPLGVKIYSLSENDPVPMTQECLIKHYEDAPTTADESKEQGKFVISWNANAPYILPRGTYAAIVFTDQPGEERDIAVVVKSSEKLDIRAFQMG